MTLDPTISAHESICYQMTHDSISMNHMQIRLPFSQPRGLIVGYPLTLRVAAVRCTHVALGTRDLSFFRHVKVSVRFNVIQYDWMESIRCNESVVTSGFVLLAQRLSFRGAIHICNERSRAAVELIHQLVPIRFQLLAVAWYMKKCEIKQRLP